MNLILQSADGDMDNDGEDDEGDGSDEDVDDDASFADIDDLDGERILVEPDRRH